MMSHHYPLPIDLICVLILCISVLGCRHQTGPAIQSLELGTIRNLHQYGNVYLAGQPSADDFALLKDRGVQVVINLRRPQETPELDEAKIVGALGMTYYNLPVGDAMDLTDQLFGQAREILRDDRQRPILLHCASANRVGAVWLTAHVLDDKVAFPEALEEARRIGLRSPALEQQARHYIEAHRSP